MFPTDQETQHGTMGKTIEHAVFRVIVDGPGNGRWNMAVDEALMESAGIPDAPPVIRFYTFTPPTLSVGRFQRTVHQLAGKFS